VATGARSENSFGRDESFSAAPDEVVPKILDGQRCASGLLDGQHCASGLATVGNNEGTGGN